MSWNRRWLGNCRETFAESPATAGTSTNMLRTEPCRNRPGNAQSVSGGEGTSCPTCADPDLKERAGRLMSEVLFVSWPKQSDKNAAGHASSREPEGKLKQCWQQNLRSFDRNPHRKYQSLAQDKILFFACKNSKRLYCSNIFS